MEVQSATVGWMRASGRGERSERSEVVEFVPKQELDRPVNGVDETGWKVLRTCWQQGKDAFTRVVSLLRAPQTVTLDIVPDPKGTADCAAPASLP